MRSWPNFQGVRRCRASRAIFIAQLAQPGEAFGSTGPRPVLAADPAVETKLVDQVEHIVVIEFAAVGLITFGNTRDLDVAYAFLPGKILP